jgi:hypothetical protein
MGVVVPTLAEQFDAAMLTVAVPWNLTREGATMVLLTAMPVERGAVQAGTIRLAGGRRLGRSSQSALLCVPLSHAQREPPSDPKATA